jgi:hypothetical protein
MAKNIQTQTQTQEVPQASQSSTEKQEVSKASPLELQAANFLVRATALQLQALRAEAGSAKAEKLRSNLVAASNTAARKANCTRPEIMAQAAKDLKEGLEELNDFPTLDLF